MNIDDFHLKAITPFDTDKILFKQSLLRVLTKVRTIVDDETGRETIKGFLRNLRIEWNGDEMYTAGSLLKYYEGRNTVNFRLSKVIKAVNKLGRELGVDLKNAMVITAHVSCCICVQKRETEYYNILLNLKKYNRHLQKNGLNYQRISKRGKTYITVYSKLYDKGVTEEAAGFLNEKYVLRPEFKLNSHREVADCLGVRVATVEEVILGYDKLINRWREIFLSIEKRREGIELKPEVFFTKGVFDKQLRMLGITAIGGIDTIEQMIRNAGNLVEGKHSNTVSNLINRCKKLMTEPTLTVKSDLAIEFERKINLMAHLAKIELVQEEILRTL